MPWARVDDQWFAHRKVVPLSLEARGLWTTALSWSCAHRTDHIERHMVAFLAGTPDIDHIVDELVTAGMWHPENDGWTIHDWSDYQERSLSEKRADAGRKGGSTPRQEANTKQTQVASEANDEAGTRPVPSRPSNPSATASPADDGFEQWWQQYPRGPAGKPGGDGSRKKAHAAWKRMSQKNRDLAFAAIANYAAYLKLPDTPNAAHASTWLNQERWEQWQTPARPQSRDGPTGGRPAEIGSAEWEQRERELKAFEAAVLGDTA